MPETAAVSSEISIRKATPADAEACGRVVDEAFGALDDDHGIPRDFPSLEHSVGLVRWLLEHPSMFGVIAERGSEALGCNFLDERDAVRGVGPVAVSPDAQGLCLGRRLMEAVLERCRDAPGVRLQQDAFNAASIGLYTSLGFEVKEPTLYLRGRPLAAHPRAVEVRPLGEDDLDECARLCRAVHGIERTNELRDGLGGALVAHRSGRLTGYAVVSYGGHGIAESEEDLWAILVAAGEAGGDIGFLLPTRQAGLLRRCLEAGMRGVKQMTLMARGEYQEPRGSWFPSVWY